MQWLAKQVPGLVCITDAEVPGVDTVKPKHDWPGWWCKLSAFDPDLIPDNLLFIDLDTVVLSLEGLDVGKSAMLTDFYYPSRPGSGLMYIERRHKSQVWQEWLRDPQGHMQRCQTKEHWGDGGFLRDVFPHKRFQDLIPNAICSYKADLKGKRPPGSAKIICFHGQPRPWHVTADWIPPCGK